MMNNHKNSAGEQATGMIVSLDELHPFPNQPFKVRDDDAMSSLVESIRQNGLLNRIIIRSRNAGGYEIIAGHRRVEAYRKLGYESISADLRTDLDDDGAAMALIEANLRQRPALLPSERARAYRMMQDAMKRRSEYKKSLNGETRNEIAEFYGEHPRQVTRYIRLSYLNEHLLDQVDKGKLKMGSAVEMSFLDEEAQTWIADYYDKEGCYPTPAQLKKLRRLSDAQVLTREIFEDLMLDMPVVCKQKNNFLALLQKEYFPDFTEEDVEQKVRELIDEYFHRRRMGL